MGRFDVTLRYRAQTTFKDSHGPRYASKRNKNFSLADPQMLHNFQFQNSLKR